MLQSVDHHKLRLGFVVYGAMNRKDWRTVDLENIGFDPDDINSQLIPTLGTAIAEEIGTPREYGDSLVEDCKRGIRYLLPFTENEQESLDLILDQGEIDGSVLTSDPILQERIASHPSLKWKALNVKRYKGL